MRHGETDANVKGILQSADWPLNKKGKEQAMQASKRFSNEKFTRAYVSDMVRAMETARIVLEPHDDVEVVYSPDLREVNPGDFVGKNKTEIIQARVDAKESLANFIPNNGESYTQGQQRFLKFYYEKIQDHIGETILIVSHGAVLVTFLMHLLGKDVTVKHAVELSSKNTAVTILEVDDKKNHNIVLMNCTRHLQQDALPAPSIAPDSGLGGHV